MSSDAALLEVIAGFRQALPESVFRRLCVCLGPEAKAALLRGQGDDGSGLFRNMLDMMAAVDEGAPEGSIGRIMGLWVFEVFEHGRSACYVRMDPPAPWNPPVVAPWVKGRERDGAPVDNETKRPLAPLPIRNETASSTAGKPEGT